MPNKNKLKSEYNTISARAKALLERSETFDVEFKESVSGLESTDIVSFANSERGGTILIGIRETKSPKGQQRGQIIGCPIGDKEKLKILSKVNSCIPDVYVEIYVENLNGKPFFRLEIPSGEDKPYCTSGGTYKIRGDGITQNLNPTQLLNMFEKKESERPISPMKHSIWCKSWTEKSAGWMKK
jgi:predicted HTH transcriptional regulator